MNTPSSQAAPMPPHGLISCITGCWRHDPKLELWLAWWTMLVFYQIFGVVFFLLAHVMPPPEPYADTGKVVQWFNHNHRGLLIGFGICFLISGLTAACNALIAYSLRRMSISRAFAYSYIALYSLSAIPGMLITAIALSVGAMRPDRDPKLLSWLYDLGFMAFDGTMGVFLIGTLIWMIAILIDKNGVLPKWFGYLNICNLITEFVVAPAWISKHGAFAWNGVITFWIDTAVFVVYTAAFITVLRRMIVREDLGDKADR
jgi:hypothetical protein